ncbi:cytochrome P450 [Pontibacter sp. G13]|uniref:cytochrome P450 n=1 Tax=Pontibacter sp. G13 TaxID=3074898 RepID=UPI00288AC516|nr:cytochrome P450 [Pontibacter sp. G13]WNJ17765.1 cytochrome P450 [Pontibacter sp. G13]
MSSTLVASESKTIPIIPGHPILGNTGDFAKGTRQFVQRIVKEYPEGIAHAKIAFRDFYLMYHPELVQHVLVKNHHNYVKSFAYDGIRTFLGNGLLTNEGDFWKKQRRSIQPAFHRTRIADMTTQMAAQTDALMDEWEELGVSQLDLQSEMGQLTRDIISLALFGPENYDPAESKMLSDALFCFRNYANDRMKNPFMAPLFVPTEYNRTFKSYRKDLQRIVFDAIHACEQSYTEGAPTIVQMLMEIGRETGETMSHQQLYDEIVTIYVAGQETTTNALFFLFHLLATHPEVERKVLAEVDGMASDGLPTVEEIRGLSYCRMVIQETLRIYPPAWAISRTNLEADHVCGYHIPKGTIQFLPLYALHHDESYWGDPAVFRPERWADGAKHRDMYLPFGSGPRVCIGNEFSLLEMQVVMAVLLRRFRLAHQSGKELDLITPMTMGPRHPVKFDLKPR